MADTVSDKTINAAIRADQWPADWHAIVDAVNAASAENDMSTEQCIALSIILSRRSSPSEAVTDETITLAKDEGADFVLDSLAKALGMTNWSQQDGSETWDGDVHATLMHLLWNAGVLDRDTNTPLFTTSEAGEAVGVERLEETLGSLDMVRDITARADAMKLGLVAYPVSDIKTVITALEQALGDRS